MAQEAKKHIFFILDSDMMIKKMRNNPRMLRLVVTTFPCFLLRTHRQPCCLTRQDREVADFTRSRVKNNTEFTNLMIS